MIIPSVTQVISPYNNFSGIAPAVLQEAAERGVRIHQACAAYALNLPVDRLELDEMLYFESFRQWFDSTIREVIAVEETFYCDIWQFTGTPDLVCILNDGSKCVIDLKTPIQFKKSWALQLAAYAHLSKAQRCFSLRLSPTGKRPRINENKHWQYDFSIFCNALAVWKYFNY